MNVPLVLRSVALVVPTHCHITITTAVELNAMQHQHDYHLYSAGVQEGLVVVLQSFFRIASSRESHESKLARLSVFGAHDLGIRYLITIVCIVREGMVKVTDGGSLGWKTSW